MTENPKKLLLIGLEFVQPLFSGNGIMTQSVVQGLLGIGYHVHVLCARPSSSSLSNISTSTNCDHSKVIKISNNEEENNYMKKHPNLTVLVVNVPPSTWKRLDRNSCYEHLAAGALEQITTTFKETPNYDYVFAIDWSAVPTIKILQKNHILSSSTYFIFLVFRVFSSSKELCSCEDDYMFYVTRELEGVRKADVTFALSHVDQMTLHRVQQENHDNEKNGNNRIKEVHVHVPPLRNDFYRQCYQMPTSHPTSSIPDVEQRKRKYVLCNVRLSPEKNALLFATIMKELSDQGTLETLNLIPLMIGSICDEEYAKLVYDTLPPETLIVNTFLSSQDMITYLHQTVLMIHPALYDAYGMTIAEAAAVGVPSLIHHENIGASSLFQNGEIIMCDMTSLQVMMECVKCHLKEEEKMTEIAEKARRKALSWNVEEYARGLEQILGKHLPGQNEKV